MKALLTSERWHFRVIRIAIIAALAWWAVKDLVYAQLPYSMEWPYTDFENRIVELSEIQSGGPPKDGIPPIDEPNFDTVSEASKWVNPREPVVVLTVNNETRAYPLQILTWHEIVNDTVGGVPVSVTFCPLCNATIVFDRRLDGRVLDFGTTGKLRKSDLVMYDRQTESWWQQFSGQGIVGEMSAKLLTRIPASIVAFEDFEHAYPSARVLSRRTGHMRPYGKNPYSGYDRIDDQPFLFNQPVDSRLPPMERVLNVTVDATHRLYPFSVLMDEPVINDQVENVPVVVFSRQGTLSVLDASVIANSKTVPSATVYDRRLDDRVLSFEVRDGRLVDRETGSEWNLFGTAVAGTLKGKQLDKPDSGVHFAFAWLAFNPQSKIYRSGDD
ncbi:MAG: DUF3179 domain-containing protein [Gammaproteobacteria bacterium]|nr:DUF3179 domain-containing protein [Gammaproteobacteria bacterium]MDH3411153.1 DUF3179 domain-containing protein [Gammaproteobacteria bacterium]